MHALRAGRAVGRVSSSDLQVWLGDLDPRPAGIIDSQLVSPVAWCFFNFLSEPLMLCCLAIRGWDLNNNPKIQGFFFASSCHVLHNVLHHALLLG